MSAKPLIIGIGNRYRGDDGLGCLIVDELKKRIFNSAEIIEHNGDPASLIDLWDGRSQVILIDAVSSGADLGTIYYFDLRQQTLPDTFRNYSTHAFGVVEAVELARVLGKLPKHIIFFGIEGESFKLDTQQSSGLEPAISALQDSISKIISHEIGESKRA